MKILFNNDTLYLPASMHEITHNTLLDPNSPQITRLDDIFPHLMRIPREYVVQGFYDEFITRFAKVYSDKNIIILSDNCWTNFPKYDYLTRTNYDLSLHKSHTEIDYRSIHGFHTRTTLNYDYIFLIQDENQTPFEINLRSMFPNEHKYTINQYFSKFCTSRVIII